VPVIRVASVPARGIQHVDLAVADVERSLAFYYALLGPLGLKEKFRNLTYRCTEEVVYLEYGVHGLGLRPADGGVYRYYEVGIEHLAFEVDTRDEVDEAYRRACPPTVRSSRHPSPTTSKTARTITRSSPLIPTASVSRSSAGRARRTATRDPAGWAAIAPGNTLPRLRQQ
jgi:catechol 2,3-dioxygenase-like lactoylglutathione lyase family enzyme